MTGSHSTENIFDKLTSALIGKTSYEVTRAVQSRIDTLTPVEASALHLAHWALNLEVEEDEVPDLYMTFMERYVNLLPRVNTARELAFMTWADCCMESALH